LAPERKAEKESCKKELTLRHGRVWCWVSARRGPQRERQLVKVLTFNGHSRSLIECDGLDDLIGKVTPDTLARVSYTNHGAHERTHTWYPVLAMRESGCDFQFEGTERNAP